VIGGELLKKAEELLEQEIHPSVITSGYRLAAERARKVLEEIATDIDINNDEELKKIARTAITGKFSEGYRNFLATSSDQLKGFVDEEERTMHRMAERIKESGANVVICQKGIDDVVQHYLAKEGIVAVRRAKKSDMEKLGKATGGKIVTERKIAEDNFDFFIKFGSYAIQIHHNCSLLLNCHLYPLNKAYRHHCSILRYMCDHCYPNITLLLCLYQHPYIA